MAIDDKIIKRGEQQARNALMSKYKVSEGGWRDFVTSSFDIDPSSGKTSKGISFDLQDISDMNVIRDFKQGGKLVTPLWDYGSGLVSKKLNKPVIIDDFLAGAYDKKEDSGKKGEKPKETLTSILRSGGVNMGVDKLIKNSSVEELTAIYPFAKKNNLLFPSGNPIAPAIDNTIKEKTKGMGAAQVAADDKLQNLTESSKGFEEENNKIIKEKLDASIKQRDDDINNFSKQYNIPKDKIEEGVESGEYLLRETKTPLNTTTVSALGSFNQPPAYKLERDILQKGNFADVMTDGVNTFINDGGVGVSVIFNDGNLTKETYDAIIANKNKENNTIPKFFVNETATTAIGAVPLVLGGTIANIAGSVVGYLIGRNPTQGAATANAAYMAAINNGYVINQLVRQLHDEGKSFEEIQEAVRRVSPAAIASGAGQGYFLDVKMFGVKNVANKFDRALKLSSQIIPDAAIGGAGEVFNNLIINSQTKEQRDLSEGVKEAALFTLTIGSLGHLVQDGRRFVGNVNYKKTLNSVATTLSTVDADIVNATIDKMVTSGVITKGAGDNLKKKIDVTRAASGSIPKGNLTDSQKEGIIDAILKRDYLRKKQQSSGDGENKDVTEMYYKPKIDELTNNIAEIMGNKNYEYIPTVETTRAASDVMAKVTGRTTITAPPADAVALSVNSEAVGKLESYYGKPFAVYINNLTTALKGLYGDIDVYVFPNKESMMDNPNFKGSVTKDNNGNFVRYVDGKPTEVFINMEKSNRYTDAHEVLHPIITNMLGSNVEAFNGFRKNLLSSLPKEVRNRLDEYASQKGGVIDAEEWLTELGAMIVKHDAYFKDPTVIDKIRIAINAVSNKLIGKDLFTNQATKDDLIKFFSSVKSGLYKGNLDESKDASSRLFEKGSQETGVSRKDYLVGETFADKFPDIKSSLEDAKKMENDGEDFRTIYEKTGWERSVAGKWMFDFIGNSEINVPAFKLSADGKTATATLADVIPESVILKGYPTIGDIEVVLDKSMSPRTGSWNRQKNRIKIGGTIESWSKDPSGLYNKLKYAIDHEIQHAIGDREGFPSGSSPELARELMDAINDDFVGYEIQDEVNSLTFEYKDVASSHGKDPSTIGRYKEFIQKRKLLIDKLENVINNNESLKKKIEGKTAEEVYIMVAGEVDANNAAYRESVMPPLRRKTATISDTEMFPRTQQIVTDANGNPVMLGETVKEQTSTEKFARDEATRMSLKEIEQNNIKDIDVLARIITDNNNDIDIDTAKNIASQALDISDRGVKFNTEEGYNRRVRLLSDGLKEIKDRLRTQEVGAKGMRTVVNKTLADVQELLKSYKGNTFESKDVSRVLGAINKMINDKNISIETIEDAIDYARDILELVDVKNHIKDGISLLKQIKKSHLKGVDTKGINFKDIAATGKENLVDFINKAKDYIKGKQSGVAGVVSNKEMGELIADAKVKSKEGAEIRQAAKDEKFNRRSSAKWDKLTPEEQSAYGNIESFKESIRNPDVTEVDTPKQEWDKMSKEDKEKYKGGYKEFRREREVKDAWDKLTDEEKDMYDSSRADGDGVEAFKEEYKSPVDTAISIFKDVINQFIDDIELPNNMSIEDLKKFLSLDLSDISDNIRAAVKDILQNIALDNDFSRFGRVKAIIEGSLSAKQMASEKTPVYTVKKSIKLSPKFIAELLRSKWGDVTKTEMNFTTALSSMFLSTDNYIKFLDRIGYGSLIVKANNVQRTFFRSLLEPLGVLVNRGGLTLDGVDDVMVARFLLDTDNANTILSNVEKLISQHRIISNYDIGKGNNRTIYGKSAKQIESLRRLGIIDDNMNILIDDNVTPQDILGNLSNAQTQLNDLLSSYLQDPNRVQRLVDVGSTYYNIPVVIRDNYTPKIPVRIGGESTPSIDLVSADSQGSKFGKIFSREANALFKRSDKSSDNIFYDTSAESILQAMYDSDFISEAAPDLFKGYGFLYSKDGKDFINGVHLGEGRKMENYPLVEDALQNMVLSFREYPFLGAKSNIGTVLSGNLVKSLLNNPSQILKQPLPVLSYTFFSTSARALGIAMKLMSSRNSRVIEFLEANSNIKTRRNLYGEQHLDLLNKNVLAHGAAKNIDTFLDKFRIDFLGRSDGFASDVSWLSGYIQELINQGVDISNIDNILSGEVNTNAIIRAEKISSEANGENMEGLKSKFNREEYNRFIFYMNSITMQISAALDVAASQLRHGATTAERVEGLRNLLGSVSSFVVFSAATAITAKATGALAEYISSLISSSLEEETTDEPDVALTEKATKLVVDILNQSLLSRTGSFVSYGVGIGASAAYKAAVQSSIDDKIAKKKAELMAQGVTSKEVFKRTEEDIRKEAEGTMYDPKYNLVQTYEPLGWASPVKNLIDQSTKIAKERRLENLKNNKEDDAYFNEPYTDNPENYTETDEYGVVKGVNIARAINIASIVFGFGATKKVSGSFISEQEKKLKGVGKTIADAKKNIRDEMTVLGGDRFKQSYDNNLSETQKDYSGVSSATVYYKRLADGINKKNKLNNVRGGSDISPEDAKNMVINTVDKAVKDIPEKYKNRILGRDMISGTNKFKVQINPFPVHRDGSTKGEPQKNVADLTAAYLETSAGVTSPAKRKILKKIYMNALQKNLFSGTSESKIRTKTDKSQNIKSLEDKKRKTTTKN